MSKWGTMAQLAQTLGVSVRTAERLRDANLKKGKHYKSKTPGSRYLIYDIEACEKTINKLCSV